MSGDVVTTDGSNTEDSTDLAGLLETAAENDTLLAQALERLEDEASGDSVDFFKHGQFGSHNA